MPKPAAQSPVPNPWDYKPWWCQPWSILLTGNGAIWGSWLLFHRFWLTGLVAVPMGIWMGFFVFLWPKLMVESGLLEELHPELRDDSFKMEQTQDSTGQENSGQKNSGQKNSGQKNSA